MTLVTGERQKRIFLLQFLKEMNYNFLDTLVSEKISNIPKLDKYSSLSDPQELLSKLETEYHNYLK